MLFRRLAWPLFHERHVYATPERRFWIDLLRRGLSAARDKKHGGPRMAPHTVSLSRGLEGVVLGVFNKALDLCRRWGGGVGGGGGGRNPKP